MGKLNFDGNVYSSEPGETVLESLLRKNLDVPYGCQAGYCHACMMQSLDSAPPETSQAGLKEALKQQNHFLPCICHPENDMEIALPDHSAVSLESRVIVKEALSKDIIRLILQYEGVLDFRAGQFVNLTRSDGLTRAYSIANPSEKDNRLEFHIRRLPNGEFSAWAYDELAVGESLTLSEAQGDCHYLPDYSDRELLLIGTGSGLAPLYGIVLDALENDHSGSIHLYHGSRNTDGLYLTEVLEQLAANNENFNFTPCISGENVPDGYGAGRAENIAFSNIPDLKGWTVFLCGHPEMINEAKKRASLNGAPLQNIYSDAFLVNSPKEAVRE